MENILKFLAVALIAVSCNDSAQDPSEMVACDAITITLINNTGLELQDVQVEEHVVGDLSPGQQVDGLCVESLVGYSDEFMVVPVKAVYDGQVVCDVCSRGFCGTGLLWYDSGNVTLSLSGLIEHKWDINDCAFLVNYDSTLD